MAIDRVVNSANLAYQRNDIKEPTAKPTVDFTVQAAKVRNNAKIEKTDSSASSVRKDQVADFKAPIDQQNTGSMKRAVGEINKMVTTTEARFGIHEQTNRVTIKLVDKDSKEVIKELPPEKTLDIIAKVWELAGLLVDEKG